MEGITMDCLSERFPPLYVVCCFSGHFKYFKVCLVDLVIIPLTVASFYLKQLFLCVANYCVELEGLNIIF